METKSAPPAKMAEAAVVALTVVGLIAYTLHHVSVEMEEHFHIFSHTLKEDVQEFKRHPGMLIVLMASFPILSMSGLLLLIPLGPYCAEHTAFQNLHVVRPDHHLRLCFKVYKAWLGTSNGKLDGKDL